MSVDNFKRTVWHANLEQNLPNRVVSEVGVNHDYEGDAVGARAVKICTIGKVTLRDYQVGTPIVYDSIDIKEQTLLIDKKDIVGLEVEDVDKAQAANGADMMIKATAEMADAIIQGRDKANFQAMYDGAGVVVSTDEAPISVKTPADAKALILKLKNLADKANVPKEGRVLFADYDLENKLLADNTINLATPTSNDSLVVGYVGRLYGIDIYGTNNLPNTDTGNKSVILTHKKFTTEAVQIYNMEALRDKDSEADYVRCFCVSGRKVIMPEGVIKAIVSYDEAQA